MSAQLIGMAIQVSNQKAVGRMFSATSCEPVQPITASTITSRPAMSIRAGAARRSSLRSRGAASPGLAATAVGRTRRNDANTTAAPPNTNTASGIGNS